MEKEESSEEVLNKSDEKEDSFKDDDGGNILDDILNTKVEKFEDDEPSKRGDSAMDDVEDDADGGDHESLEEHNIETEDILGSDISSEGEESDHGNESDNSDISHNSDSEQEEETEPNSSELGVKTEKSPSPESDKSTKAETKKKGKKYDYPTKLNYLFRDARFFLVKSNNAENVSLAKVGPMGLY